jgi:indole-3-glycerol phosphate synthase/phosphoribosylanthranilate isomerase
MVPILAQIVAGKREQIARQQQRWPLEWLKDNIRRSDRHFAEALRNDKPAFILECKKASPSKGLIRADFDVTAISRIYSEFASAISVLTETEFFKGSLEYLLQVRHAVRQPLLCKDFIFDPWQVYAARFFGADALLLILAILDDALYRQLAGLAAQLGMDVLTEISNEDERSRAIELAAPIVGINNRNLRDMSVDLATTRRLARGLSGETLVVSESGYFTNGEVRANRDVAGAFLVGSSLMAEKDLPVAIKRLVLGDHKVCGLTSREAAIAADQGGAVYGGVIFAPGSPRQVTLQQARDVLEGTRLLRVGVFQDPASSYVEEAVATAQLDCIQLHGDESPDFVASLRDETGSGVRLWKALTVDQIDRRTEYLAAGIDRIVVDQKLMGRFGGTGRGFDWSLLPADDRDRMMVAGGLGIDNLAAALALGAAGLDFNSSLETAPGTKSPQRIGKLFQAIREY